MLNNMFSWLKTHDLTQHSASAAPVASHTTTPIDHTVSAAPIASHTDRKSVV